VHGSTCTAGGYRLGAGAALPPLLLDDEEAVAVAIGLRSAAMGSVEGIAEASVRALAKIDQVLPSRLRRRVEALRAATVTVDSRAAKVSAQVLALLAAACRDRERVRFDYTARAGQDSLREVEPYRLVHTGRRWYLVAYDIGRADWRTFRVDRMRPRTPAGPRFAPREEPAKDTAGWTARRLAVEQYPYRARITMQATAQAVADRIPPEYGLIEPLDADSCMLTVGGDRLGRLPQRHFAQHPGEQEREDGDAGADDEDRMERVGKRPDVQRVDVRRQRLHDRGRRRAWTVGAGR